ncbi:MAG: carboxylating nicotinate-nucleotide diphosphorylase [Gemmatimonadota bacterium]|nr:carboxylating nicotinate-nucleotide diphosphorylase [Gemmatimonadota bacterium]
MTRATGDDALVRSRHDLVVAALEEDVGEGDWTTLWTIPATAEARAVIVAKMPLVVAGTACVEEVFRQVDPDLTVETEVADGVDAEVGDVLFRLSGRTHSILVGERTALNFLGRLAGIATQARRYVAAVEGTGAQVIDTRKTTPGWRLLEKEAVRAAGAANHRMGLYDMVLVKDNHADACGGVAAAARAAVTRNDRGIPVEVEVRSLEELEAVLPVGVDRILLDNMPPEVLQRAVSRVDEWAGSAQPGAPQRPRPELEASGNVTLASVRTVALTGVDFISVGALTHSAPVADVSLRMVT